MLNIDKLLKKKGWTGSELGRLEVITTLQGYSQAKQGKEPQPAVSRSDFQKMLSTIQDPIEESIYNGYIAIHKWLADKATLALAHEQQAQLQYNKLVQVLSNAITAEDIYKYISELPVIMTEKQYKDLVESRKKEILHPDGEDIGFNIFNMLEQALMYYINLIHKDPRKKNVLKPLKKTLEQELVTDPKILSRYNKVMENGYYELEDGTRSDEVTDEEWQELLKDIWRDLVSRQDIKEDTEAYNVAIHILEKQSITETINFYNGTTASDHARHVNDIKNEIASKVTWHYYNEIPEDLNKWEILEAGDLFEYYPILKGEGTDEEQISDVEDFEKEFPEVVKALLSDMERYVKGISSIPTEKWLDTVYMWEDLYNLDFYGFKTDFVESDTMIFDGNYRAIFNGITILKPSDLLNKSPRIDPDTGYYSAPDIGKSLSVISLEAYFTDNENYSDNVENIEDARQTMLESIYFLNGFNLALDLIANQFNLEEIQVAKVTANGLLQRIEAFNTLLDILYKRIQNIVYEDKELQEKKLRVLKDIFYPIDTNVLSIPDGNIEKVKSNMKDFKAFKNKELDPLVLLSYKEW